MLYVPRYRRRAGYGAMAAAAGYGAYQAAYTNPQGYRAFKKVASHAARKAYEYYGNRSRTNTTYKGGAAPIPNKGAFKKQARKRYRKAKATRKLKGYKLSKEVMSLKNQIKDLKHSEDASLGKMKYRRIRALTQQASDNVQNVVGWEVNRPGSELETALSNLLYFDPSAPATLINASPSTGAYQREFLIKSISSTMSFRNNYQTDADITIYLCTPKNDSSISAKQAWTDGITQDAGNTSAVTEYGVYPSDFDTFRDLWNAKRLCRKTLSPGESTVVSHGVSDIQYDPSLYDEHTSTYQPRFKNFSFLVVLKGTAAHDTSVANQEGVAACGVDILMTDTYDVHYDAGINLSFVHTDRTLDTPTNGFVQSHQPVPDNIAYSVA